MKSSKTYPKRTRQQNKISDETRKKMSDTHKKIGSGKWMKGRKLPLETRLRMSKSRTGVLNHKWKGREVGYFALHTWINRVLGSPKECEHCGTTTARKFEWANKSGRYLRSLDDWIRLCTSCHRRYDNAR